MYGPKTLNFLGAVPELLIQQMELANSAWGYRSFRISMNIPFSDPEGYYVPPSDWQVEWLGSSASESLVRPDGLFALSVVGCDSKRVVYNHFKKLWQLGSRDFCALVHATSYIAPSVTYDGGLHLEPSAVISSNCEIGFGVNIKRRSSIGHHCRIGDFVSINPGVTVCSKVAIGAGSSIGAGAVLRDGIEIGKDAVIGMGSVVLNDIPDNCVAFGNPCKVRKSSLES